MANAHRILGVSSNASDTEVKKAYRKMALRYHPDVNNSADAQAKFLVVTKAYQDLLLGDTRARVPAPGTYQTAKDFEEELKQKQREAAKARIRKMRKAQEEAFLKSPVYKVAVFIKLTVTYIMVVMGLAMMVIPAVSVFREWGTPDAEPERWFYFGLIGLIGFIFLRTGIYLIKNDVE